MSGLIAGGMIEKIGTLSAKAKECRKEIALANSSGDEFSKMFIVAAARQQLLDIMSSNGIVDMLMPLQGSPLGFKTDKDSQGGYDKKIIAQVAAQAILSGLRLTDSEVAIIGGNLYAAKEGCRRLCKEIVSDLQFIPGIPELKHDDPIEKQGKHGTYTVQRSIGYVPCKLRYKLDGKQVEEVYEGAYRIVVNCTGGGEDMAIGKAERKVYKRLAEKLSGIKLGEDADEPIDVVADVVIEPEQPEGKLDAFYRELEAVADRKGIEPLKNKWSQIALDELWTASETDAMVDSCRAKWSSLPKV